MQAREPPGRKLSEIRPLSFEIGISRYAEGSVLIKAGHTHVLCTASVEENVPSWLSGKGKGWITAEYAMLPRSTHTRSRRDREKVSGRTQEIQRLIGRALRATVDLKALGERSIVIDCDVLQADGGTRTASITGGYLALALAIHKLQKDGKIPTSTAPILTDTVSAISVGLKEKQVFVDLDYNEDSTCGVDMNFVMTGKNQFVEIQGTGEHQTFSKDDLDLMTQSAIAALAEVRAKQLAVIRELSSSNPHLFR